MFARTIVCTLALALLANEVRSQWDGIQISGNRTYSVAQIQLGLKADAKFHRFVLETESTEERAERIAEKIANSYREAGYLSVAVSARKCSDTEYQLYIEEGVVCQLKAFDIVGIDKGMADQLAAFLTGKHRKQDEQWIPSIDGKEMQVRAWDRMGVPEWRDPSEQGMKIGNYLTDTSLSSLQWRVSDFFTSMGYASAKFQLELIVDSSGQSQTLRIVVEDLGPELIVSEFVFEGEDRVPTERWMEQLGLSKNMQWTHLHAQRVQSILFAKGVFRIHDVVWTHLLHNPNEVRVNIRILRSEFPIEKWQSCSELAEVVQRWNENDGIAVDLVVVGSDRRSARTLSQMFLVEGRTYCKVKNVLEDATGVTFRILGSTDLNAAETKRVHSNIGYSASSKSNHKPSRALLIAPYAVCRELLLQGEDIKWQVEGGIRFIESERMELEVDNETNRPTKLVVFFTLPSNEQQIEITFRAIEKERTAQAKEEFIADTKVEHRYPWTRFMQTVSHSKGDKAWELKPFVTSECSPTARYALWLASLVERSLGEESPQFKLFEKWVGDQSVFVSEFEEKLESIRADPRFGPISAFLFCAVTDSSATSVKNCIAKVGLERLAFDTQTEQRFAMEKMEALRSLHQVLVELFLTIEPDLVEILQLESPVAASEIKRVAVWYREHENPVEATLQLIQSQSQLWTPFLQSSLNGYVQTLPTQVQQAGGQPAGNRKR